MRARTFSRTTTIASLLLLVALGVLAISLVTLGPSESADHADAPGVVGDPAADINDIYAFRSPENPDNLIVALTVNPLTAPGDTTATFAEDVAYEVHVDNTGDFVADATVTVTFSEDMFRLVVEALGVEIEGPVTAPGSATPIITESGGISVFAGPRDDPFFFDLVAFQIIAAEPFVPINGLRGADDTPADTLAGTNVSAIVMELPIVALPGAETSDTGVIRAWATTSRDGVRVDRMAIPALNTAVVPPDAKDAYNAGDPVDDEAAFLEAATDSMQGLRDAFDAVLGEQDGGALGDLSAGEVADFVLPDVVTIDFATPVAFPFGRGLAEDVADIAVGLVLNRGGAAGVSDGIDANDMPFLDAFPYLAAPHAPAQEPMGEVELLPLQDGLNLVGWFGAPTTSAEILANNLAITSIFFFDPATDSYIADSRVIPAPRRPTINIVRGNGFFAIADGATNLRVPLAP